MVLDAFAIRDEPDRVYPMLEELWRSGYDPATDTFLATYAQTKVSLSLTPVLSVTLPLDRDALGLALAEEHQERGHLGSAIDVVEQVTPSTYAAVSLAELYSQQGRWDDVISLTEGIANEDDLSTLLLIQRGVAFREQRYHVASRESLKLALAPRSRTTELRHLALIERAATYVAQGKRAMARKDLERVLAEDSTRAGVRELIDDLSATSN